MQKEYTLKHSICSLKEKQTAKQRALEEVEGNKNNHQKKQNWKRFKKKNKNG
jgi:hypothetical protein